MAWKHYTQDGRLKDRGGLIPLTGVVCRVYRNAAVSIASLAVLPFDTRDFDPYGWFDITTNFRFQPKVAGAYDISAAVAGPTNVQMVTALYKNGSVFAWGSQNAVLAGDLSRSVVSTVVFLNGTTDYVDIRPYNNSGTVAISTTAATTYFSASLVGASTGFLPGSYPPGPQSGSPAAVSLVPVADGSGSYSWATIGSAGTIAVPYAILSDFSATLKNPGNGNVVAFPAEVHGNGMTVDAGKTTITVPTAGLYAIAFQVGANPSTTTYEYSCRQYNSVGALQDVIAISQVVASGPSEAAGCGTGIARCSAGDLLRVVQESSQAVNTAFNTRSRFCAWRIGAQ